MVFSATQVSFTNKTDRHHITELLLKVAIIITSHQPPKFRTSYYCLPLVGFTNLIFNNKILLFPPRFVFNCQIHFFEQILATVLVNVPLWLLNSKFNEWNDKIGKALIITFPEHFCVHNYETEAKHFLCYLF